MATTEKLLEREAELRELEAALVAAASDSGRMVLVEAPAGIGKTSLLAAASLIADGLGFTALRARATELERDFAYGCVRQLLEPTVVRAADPERERLWHGAAELARGLFGPDSDPRSSEGDFAFLHGLYWLVSNLAEERPLLLCVDDVHWADAESLRFLNYLAPRLDGLPVAVVACARTGERPIAELSRLATAPEARVLRPRPLSTGASATVCRRALGDGVAPEFVAACRRATGGNPFFLEALLREVREREIAPDAAGARQVESIGPAAVTEALRVRLAERPPAATALVRAVAVLGDGSRLGEAALLAGLGEQEAARTADLLAALSILREADGLEFTHPIVREAVFAQIGPLERGEWHARAAEILAANRGSEERIAAQLVGAPPAADPERVALLRRVAADALARGAPRSAGAWLARALAEPPPAEELAAVLVGLGSAELRIGAPGAVEHLEAAVELISEPELLATAACQLGNALTISGRADEAVEALERTLDAVASQRREHGLTMVAELASHAQQGSVELREPAAELLERQTGLAGETPGERLVLAGLAFNRARAAESEGEAAELLERALAGGRLVGELRYDLIGPVYDVIVGLLATDALELADRCVADALADARARASVPSVAFLTDRRGWAAIRRGDVARAEADARTGIDLLTAHGIPLGLPLAYGLLVAALIERGELEAAERELDRGGMRAEVPPGPTSGLLVEAQGRLHLAQGRLAEGIERLEEFGRRDERWGGANPLASRWRSRIAIALAAGGDRDEAERFAADDLERARRWGAGSGLGIAMRAAALADGGERAVEGLREAAAILGRSPARLEHAHCLVDLGAALRRANRRTEARAELERGLELARSCGADALVARARTELRASGGRSGDPLAVGVEQLTVSERRVAELAAEGMSNPEIAQALFVTRKTVETHLSRVYRKLDVSGRGRLARALAEAPVGDP